jgi:hypothetical protein
VRTAAPGRPGTRRAPDRTAIHQHDALAQLQRLVNIVRHQQHAQAAFLRDARQRAGATRRAWPPESCFGSASP